MFYNAHPASFRDPAGFVFERETEVYRAISGAYKADYDCLMTSGLYEALTAKRQLIPHLETDMPRPDGVALVIKPERIPFISYPYEWCFSQLREAALLTLGIQAKALDFDMTLKDASVFNITWRQGRPIFMDTLSLVRLKPDAPWAAYGQFCSHFLAPLALMSHKDIRLQKLIQTNIGGIPLDLASSLLPKRTWLKLGQLVHIHLHARSQKKHADSAVKARAALDKKAFRNLIEGLRIMVEGFKLPDVVTEWGDYYNDTNYSPAQFQEKKDVVAVWIKEAAPGRVCDLGANDGTFSRLAAQTAAIVVAADIDPIAVEKNCRRCKKDKDEVTVPLLADLTQPSPGLGWELKERSSLFERLKPELGLALALVHHLAIGNNVPLPKICSLLSGLAPSWIVEFPDKPDSQVRRLLLNREDIFPDYNQPAFEAALKCFFDIKDKRHITESQRTLYLLTAGNRAAASKPF
jgi:ribosomal protein L11 methylase PrmA